MGDTEPIGIRELRQNASQYVDMAERGLRVPVTKRGKLVAYLVPADQPRSMYEQMVAAGQVRPAVGPLGELLASWEPLRSEPGEPTLSTTLRRMRAVERQ